MVSTGSHHIEEFFVAALKFTQVIAAVDEDSVSQQFLYDLIWTGSNKMCDWPRGGCTDKNAPCPPNWERCAQYDNECSQGNTHCCCRSSVPGKLQMLCQHNVQLSVNELRKNLEIGKLTTTTVKWQWQYKNRMGKILETCFRSRFEGDVLRFLSLFYSYMNTSQSFSIRLPHITRPLTKQESHLVTTI